MFFVALTVFALASCEKDKKNNGDDNGNGNEEPAFVAAINIDGDLSDWAGISTKLEEEGGPVFVFKATSDEKFVYFYIKRNFNGALFPPEGNGYFYFCMEVDGDGTNGDLGDDEGKLNGQHKFPYGMDSWFYAHIYTGTAEAPEIASTPTGGHCYPEDFLSKIACAGKCIEDESIEFEMSVPREDLLVQKGQTVRIHTWGNKSASNMIDKALTITIDK